MVKTFHDDYGNTAMIKEGRHFPYKGAKEKQADFILTLSADYEDNFIYFVSLYETEKEAMDHLKKFSCGTFR